MSNISISNLNVTGSDLFCDSESYLHDIIEDEMIIYGGAMTTVVQSTKKCFDTVPGGTKTPFLTIPMPTPPDFIV
jgi:hypothetical protein